MPSPPNLSRSIAVACGGNAEALVRLATGPFVGRIPTINVRLLRDQTWRLLRLDVPGRMRVFRVRQDRAEVMGIAAIIITTLAKWLGLRSLLVPGRRRARRASARSGRRAILRGRYFRGGKGPRRRVAGCACDGLPGGSNYDPHHAEQVSRLALSLFDQLRPLHELGAESATGARNGRAASRYRAFRESQSAQSPWRIFDLQQ